jgi:hypothetical protein
VLRVVQPLLWRESWNVHLYLGLLSREDPRDDVVCIARMRRDDVVLVSNVRPGEIDLPRYWNASGPVKGTSGANRREMRAFRPVTRRRGLTDR